MFPTRVCGSFPVKSGRATWGNALKVRLSGGWSLAIIVALIMAALASIPQLHPLLFGDDAMNNSFVSYYFDEPAYLVYVQGLIDGQPRRSDPYAGLASQDPNAQSESLFSIQFLPSYILAVPARLLGASSTEAFTVLRTVSAFLSALAIFWLLRVFTSSLKVATLGTLIVLCLGCYASSSKSLSSVFALQSAGFDFPFLRCSVPALPFPLFFVFCGVVYKALVSPNRNKSLAWAALGGLCFTGLLFSYFFLWTAAAAWLSCIVFVWISGLRRDSRRIFPVVGIVCLIGLWAMVPYTFLLLQRSPTMDAAQLLIRSHSLDFSHRSEFIGLAILLVLGVAIKLRYLDSGHHLNRIIVSFALLPLVLFNQQLITGYSLQPFHYELYVAPYSVTLAAVLLAILFLRRQQLIAPLLSRKRTLILFCITTLVVARATATTIIMSSRNLKSQTVAAEKFAVLKTMHKQQAGENEQGQVHRPNVFFTDLDQADMAPAVTRYQVLWSPHMFVFPNVTAVENKERLYRYLYFSGVTQQDFAAMASVNSYLSLALFGFERASRQDDIPDTILPEHVAQERESYSRFIELFDRKDASALKIEYVVTPSQGGPDLSNFDRWYERYDGFSVGDFTMWRVKPRT